MVIVKLMVVVVMVVAVIVAQKENGPTAGLFGKLG